MLCLVANKKAISKALFIGTVVVLVVICAVVSFMGYGQITSLNSQITSLQSGNANLQNQIDSKNAQIDNLNSQIASLQSQMDSLHLQQTNLQNQYAGLQANYSKLMNDYQLALAKIPSDKGITIDAVNHSAGIVTGVAVRNLGVNPVTVVSLKLYWTNQGVLASSASVNIVILGNSTVGIPTSLSKTGWTTVYDTWVLRVETSQGYNATSDSITLALD